MATVSFSPAGEVLYAYLAGEIDHDAAQSLRIQLDDALVSRDPTDHDPGLWRGRIYGFIRCGADPGAAAHCPRSGHGLRVQHTPSQLEKVLQLARIPCTDAGQKEE